MSQKKLNVAGCFGVSLTIILSGLPAKAVTFTLGQNFQGLNVDDVNRLSGSRTFPPDTMGAVGPNHFVEFTNNGYAVFDKNSAKIVEASSDTDFWKNAGVIEDSTGKALGGDPRVLFDAKSNRWFAAGFEHGATSIDIETEPSTTNNSLLLAVSKSADPRQGWTGFKFGADPNYFTDFPTLGINSQGVYLGGVAYDHDNNGVKNAVFSIPKSDLLSSTPTISHMTIFDPVDFKDYGFLIQPAVDLGASSTIEPLLAVPLRTPTTQLLLSSLSNTATTNASFSSPTSIAVNPYVPSPSAIQPDGTRVIETTRGGRGGRIASSVKQVGDNIWGAISVDNNGSSAIRWYEINAKTGAKLQEGTISDPNHDYYYPSIAVNESGNVVIGFSGSGSENNQFASSYAVVGETIGGTTTFSDPQLLMAGNANYHPFDPNPSNPNLTNSVLERWGDYSETTIDPTNPNSFWTVQEYAVSADAWGTQITQINIATPVPEPPATLGLMILGLCGSVYRFTKQKASHSQKKTNSLS